MGIRLTPQDPRFFDSYLLETGWGLLYTFLVAAPLLAMAIRPGLTMPIVQVAAVGVAVGVTAVVSGSFGQLIPAGLLLLNAAFAADLGRGTVLLHDGLPDKRLSHAVRVQP